MFLNFNINMKLQLAKEIIHSHVIITRLLVSKSIGYNRLYVINNAERLCSYCVLALSSVNLPDHNLCLLSLSLTTQ